MTDEIVLWHNPRCSTSRTAKQLLGDDVPTRLYLEDPPSREELEDLLRKLGTDDPRVLVRTKEPAYQGLENADRDELLEAMVRDPILIQRPVAIRGDRAVIGRPVERLLEL